MATLGATVTTVTDMIRRSDLTTEAKEELQNAIRHYARRNTWLHEHRGGTVTASAGTAWYSTIDLTAGAGVDDGYSGTDPTSTTDLDQLLGIDYAKLVLAVDWPLDLVNYRTFETLAENTTTSGTPRYITRYAGQIGLWPSPDSAYTVYISGKFKPVIPSGDSDESVWLDKYNELIECAAARRLAVKHLQDYEMAQGFAAEEREQEALLLAEGATRRTIGKLQPTVI